MLDKHWAAVITLTTAFIYYIGWAYLYNYYNFFGIDLFEIAPSLQNILIYAFPALLYLFSPQGELYVFVPMLLLLGVVAYFSSRSTRPKLSRWERDNTRMVVSNALTIFGLLLMVEGYRSAKNLAMANAIEKWMNDSNPAIVQFSSPIRSNVGDFDQSLSNRLADLNNKSRLRFILSTA